MGLPGPCQNYKKTKNDEGRTRKTTRRPAHLPAGLVDGEVWASKVFMVSYSHHPNSQQGNNWRLGEEEPPSDYWTVSVKVTVADCAPVATVAPLSGFTATPTKRVTAVPLVTPGPTIVSGVPV